MGNVLAEILAGEYFVNDELVDPAVARRMLGPFIYRPSDPNVGALGVLQFATYEFAEIVQRIPETDDLITNSLEDPPLELLDAIRGEDGYLVLPTDTSDTPAVMLFEFAKHGRRCRIGCCRCSVWASRWSRSAHRGALGHPREST